MANDEAANKAALEELKRAEAARKAAEAEAARKAREYAERLDSANGGGN